MALIVEYAYHFAGSSFLCTAIFFSSYFGNSLCFWCHSAKEIKSFLSFVDAEAIYAVLFLMQYMKTDEVAFYMYTAEEVY